MLAAARNAAVRAGQSLTLIEGTAEALPAAIGTFDVVTIGRALHWMERGAVAALFERLVAPRGVIVVCSARSAAMRSASARGEGAGASGANNSSRSREPSGVAPGSIFVTVQAAAPPVGLVALTALPLVSTATHSTVEHETALIGFVPSTAVSAVKAPPGAPET